MPTILRKTKLEDGRTLVAYENPDCATEVILFWGKPPFVEGSMKVAKDKWMDKYKDFGGDAND